MEQVIETTTEVAEKIATQTPFYIEHIDTIVTIVITIIGFVVTYLMTKKNFKDEVKKNKIALASEQIESLPYDICQLMDAMIKGTSKDVLEKYGSILSKVLAYGSSQAVNIAIKMQRMSYESSTTSSLDERLPILAAYSLLITQLKYDLTSEIISPESWFKLRMNDYDKNIQPKMKKAINDLINELHLNSSFKV